MITKTYKGETFYFKKISKFGYKYEVKSGGSTWRQSNASVTEAYRRKHS